MKNNENLSVEEILREADEMLNHINTRMKSSASDTEETEVKTFTPKSGQAVCEKTQVIEKTRHIDVSDKTIISEKVTKKHYFQHNPVDEDYSSEPPKIIERAATIKSKSRFNKTSDLQEIPTILAVEELGKTRLVFGDSNYEENQSSENDYDLSDQIKISGFDDEFDEIPVIDEDVAEEQLRQRREDKINKFRLFAKEEVTADSIAENGSIVSGSAADNANRTKILEQLFKKKSALQAAAVITVILGGLLLLLTLFKDSYRMPYFLSTDKGFYITALVLYGAVLIVNINTIIHGLNLAHGINSDFPVTISAVAALVHTSALFLNTDIFLSSSSVFPSAAAFAMVLSLLGKRSMVMRIISNYDFLTDGKEKYCVEDIVNEVDATIISRNLLSGVPLLKYSVKTDVPTSFLEISFAYEPADKMAKILAPVMIFLNAVLMAVIGFIEKDWYYAFNVFTEIKLKH